MARFRADEVENYGGQGGAGFFSLKNDKDVARVRIMYNNMDDVDGYACHKVKINDRDRYVNCLRDYNEPKDKCPFCADGMPVYAKLFLPLYNEDDGQVQLWDRGKKFFAKISSLCSRYATKDNLVNHVFEIERNGKAGDQQTTYEIYEVDSDDTELEDLPEVPEIIGGLVLDKSADDMNYYLDEHEFPPTDNEHEDEAPRRRGSEREEYSRRDTGRRTPATRTRRGEEF